MKGGREERNEGSKGGGGKGKREGRKRGLCVLTY